MKALSRKIESVCCVSIPKRTGMLRSVFSRTIDGSELAVRSLPEIKLYFIMNCLFDGAKIILACAKLRHSLKKLKKNVKILEKNVSQSFLSESGAFFGKLIST